MLPVMKRAASWKTSTLHGDAVIRQRRIHPAPATSRMIISRSSPPIRVKERRKRKIFSSTIKVFCSTTSGTCAIVWGRRVPDVTSDVPNVSPPNAATSAGTTGGGSMTSSRWTETRGLSGKTNSKQSQTTVLDTSGQLNDTWCEQLVETNIISIFEILYLIMIVQNYVENVSFEPIKFDLSLSWDLIIVDCLSSKSFRFRQLYNLVSKFCLNTESPQSWLDSLTANMEHSCPFCSRKYPSSPDLVKHKYEEHKEAMFRCLAKVNFNVTFGDIRKSGERSLYQSDRYTAVLIPLPFISFSRRHKSVYKCTVCPGLTTTSSYYQMLQHREKGTLIIKITPESDIWVPIK